MEVRLPNDVIRISPKEEDDGRPMLELEYYKLTGPQNQYTTQTGRIYFETGKQRKDLYEKLSPPMQKKARPSFVRRITQGGLTLQYVKNVSSSVCAIQ